MSFNPTLFVSQNFSNAMKNATQELMKKALMKLSNKYSFPYEEALIYLKLDQINIASKKKVSKPKIKTSVPMPYNGEFDIKFCHALRLNHGLYTQCKIERKNATYCKNCQSLADKRIDGIPEYGTIHQRKECDIFEFKDTKQRSPVPYTKIMRKFKVDQAKVLEEAKKLNITIDERHFIVPENVKRGRRKSESTKTTKTTKGRPRNPVPVMNLENGDDLFNELVASSQHSNDESESDDESEIDDEISKNKKRKGTEATVDNTTQNPTKRTKTSNVNNTDAKNAKEITQNNQHIKDTNNKTKDTNNKTKDTNKLNKANKANKAKVTTQDSDEKPAEEFHVIKYGTDNTKYGVSSLNSYVYDLENLKEDKKVLLGKYNRETKTITWQKNIKSDEDSDEESNEESDESYLE